MAATQTTPNYGLPIYGDTDSTSWADFNKAMNTIDTDLKEVSDAASDTSGKLPEMQANIQSLTNTVAKNTADIGTNTSAIAQANAEITTSQEAISNLDVRVGAAEGNISTLQTQVTETVLGELQDVKTDVTTVEGNVSTLSSTVSTLGTRTTNLETKVNAIPDGIGDTVEELQAEVAGGLNISKNSAINVNIQNSSETYTATSTTSAAQKAGLYVLEFGFSSSQIDMSNYNLIAANKLITTPVGVGLVVDSLQVSHNLIFRVLCLLNADINFTLTFKIIKDGAVITPLLEGGALYPVLAIN